MHFLALATDYDGTIAHDGVVPPSTLAALRRLRDAGRQPILVTGRELPDLQRVLPELDIFVRVVAENGALLYDPASRQSRPLGPPPPPAFLDSLRAKGVRPLSVGEVIVATWEPQETPVLEAVRELGLDLQIIFNKGAVMVLPSGVNKASGLAAALDDLGLSPLNVVAVGDAENDLAFMRTCGCAVAVANALEAVRQVADFSTAAPRGAGVEQLIDLMLTEESRLLEASLGRHAVVVGTDGEGRSRAIRPGAGNVLIAGSSGGGKSTLATGLLERMNAAGAQFCIFDPEGDYAKLDSAVVFGDAKTVPRAEPVFVALATPRNNVVIEMLGLAVADRPGLFAAFYPAVLQQRAATGRPHWCLIDEAHHMLPKHRAGAGVEVPSGEPPAIFVTVHPEALAPEILRGIGCVLAIGDSAAAVIGTVAEAQGSPRPALPREAPEKGQALMWFSGASEPAVIVDILGPKQAQLRHTRKYAEGELGEDKSFYFRGPAGRLNLRAQNLMLFLQMAEGVDDQTFLFHLRRGDYTAWFRTSIKDSDLADASAELEAAEREQPADLRKKLRHMIETRYTAPAEGAF